MTWLEFKRKIEETTSRLKSNAVPIAVLLRIIDVLEGRQELGKHAAKKLKIFHFPYCQPK